MQTRERSHLLRKKLWLLAKRAKGVGKTVVFPYRRAGRSPLRTEGSQMEAIASMRGASILGVVVLLSLLSVGAVALDSRFSQDSMSQVAAETTAVTPKKEGPTKEQIAQKCYVGYDYVVENDKEEKGKAKISTTLDGKTPLEPPKGNQCEGKVETEKSADGRICKDKEWNCKIFYCTPDDELFKALREKNGECRLLGYSPTGNDLKPENFRDAGMSEDLVERISQGKLSSAEQEKITSYKSTLSSGVLNSFIDERVKTNTAALVDKTSDVSAATKQLNEYQKTGVCDRSAECSLLEQRQSTLNKEIHELTEQNKNLSDVKKLTSESSAESGNDSKKDDGNKNNNNNNNNTSCAPYCNNNNNSFNDGNNSGLTAACQGGNQQACQQIAGISSGYGANSSGNDPYCITSYEPLIVQSRPATPGCLNYRAQTSQQCGSQQQQQGGLIGTIVSLFKKDNNSNSNCVNGMLVPTCTLTASPQNISAAGQSAQLTWQSQNAYSASLSNAGNIPTQGSMTINPQTTTTYTMFVQGARNSQTGQQLSGQCSVQVTVGNQGGSNDEAPKAEISCSPQLADVGMSVAVSFGCRNLGTGAGMGTSAGTGFSTNNAPSGSATPD